MPDREENARFLRAVETVLKHEGGWANDPVDPGGATNFGISLRFLMKADPAEFDGIDLDFDDDGDTDADDVRLMPRETAIELYRRCWWDRYHYNLLPEPVGEKVFDLAVNMGARQAHKLLQRALGMNAVDGIIGPATRAVLGKQNPGIVHAMLREYAAKFYRDLIAQRPAFEKYRTGWLRRAAA